MNSAWIQVSLATAVAWIGTLVAALVRRGGSRVMRPLVYVALLFFAVVAIFDILPESKRVLSWPILVASVAAGYAVFWFVGKYVAPICPACAMHSVGKDHHHAHGSAWSLFAAVIGVHCFLDGIGVSAASAVQPAFGIRVFWAIAVHKLPEGFALALMLMAGGRSARAAVGWAVGIEAATVAGALAAALWNEPSPVWAAVVLAHIGGTFLYLSVNGLRDALSQRPSHAVTAHA